MGELTIGDENERMLRAHSVGVSSLFVVFGRHFRLRKFAKRRNPPIGCRACVTEKCSAFAQTAAGEFGAEVAETSADRRKIVEEA